jgi:hypothetical protein
MYPINNAKDSRGYDTRRPGNAKALFLGKPGRVTEPMKGMDGGTQCRGEKLWRCNQPRQTGD